MVGREGPVARFLRILYHSVSPPPVMCLNETAFSLKSRPDVSLAGFASDTGSGPVGLFLHGFRSDAHGQKALALAAHARARGYSWVRFDLAAHGLSSGVFEDQSLSGWLADALGVAQKYAPRPLILVGSSLGAWLAVLMARQGAQNVAGLILVAPAFNFLQRRYDELPQAVQDLWRTQGYLLVPDPYAAGTGQYKIRYEVVADARRHDVLTGPLTLPCPLVIIHGAADELVPVSVSEEFLAQVTAPERELRVIPGGDHRLTKAIPEILAAVDRLWARALVDQKVPA